MVNVWFVKKVLGKWDKSMGVVMEWIDVFVYLLLWCVKVVC